MYNSALFKTATPEEDSESFINPVVSFSKVGRSLESQDSFEKIQTIKKADSEPSSFNVEQSDRFDS